jgi:hypothetical protein
MSAAHYRYKKDTLTWTPDGGGGPIDIEGLVSIRFDEQGETTKLISDDADTVQELPLHSIMASGSITVLSQLAGKIPLGGGVLAWTMERVKTGRGAVSGEDQDFSIPNAVLKGRSIGLGIVPGENTQLTFEGAADENGDTIIFDDAA